MRKAKKTRKKPIQLTIINPFLMELHSIIFLFYDQNSTKYQVMFDRLQDGSYTVYIVCGGLVLEKKDIKKLCPENGLALELLNQTLSKNAQNG